MSLMMLLILAGIGRIVYVDATAAKDKVVLLKSTTTADMIKTTESASEPEVTAVPATAAPEVTQTVTTAAPEVTQNVTTKFSQRSDICVIFLRFLTYHEFMSDL